MHSKILLCNLTSTVLPCPPHFVPQTNLQTSRPSLRTYFNFYYWECPIPQKNPRHSCLEGKGNQPWIFTGRTGTEAEAPILWLPDAKSWLIGKDLDPGQDWGQEEKGVTEDEIVGWHHQLNGHEFEWTPGVGDGQGGLACCSPWSCKESDMNEWLNWTEH